MSEESSTEKTLDMMELLEPKTKLLLTLMELTKKKGYVEKDVFILCVLDEVIDDYSSEQSAVNSINHQLDQLSKENIIQFSTEKNKKGRTVDVIRLSGRWKELLRFIRVGIVFSNKIMIAGIILTFVLFTLSFFLGNLLLVLFMVIILGLILLIYFSYKEQIIVTGVKKF